MQHAHDLLSDGTGTADRGALTDIQQKGGEARWPVNAVVFVEMLIFRDYGTDLPDAGYGGKRPISGRNYGKPVAAHY
jgi:hypothetical protein